MFKKFKRNFAILLAFFLGAGIVIVSSCKHSNGDCKGEIKNSSTNESESHNMGKNCLGCHYSGGQGEGCFTAAGTVYDSLQTSTKPGGAVKLYTGPNGTGDLVSTLEIDELGNFYTGKSINFIGGLYPSVTSKSGKTKYMSTPISLGACNSCHGVSTGKIWVP